MERTLSEKIADRATGIEVRYPEGWKATKGDLLINVGSPDGCLVVSIGAPVGAAAADRLGGDLVADLEQRYGKIQEQALEPSEIDRLPTKGSLVAVRNREGGPVVIRLSVAEGERFAYLIQTVYRGPPCAESSPTADLIIENLDLSK